MDANKGLKADGSPMIGGREARRQGGNLQVATVVTLIGDLTDYHLVFLVSYKGPYSAIWTPKIVFVSEEFCVDVIMLEGKALHAPLRE